MSDSKTGWPAFQLHSEIRLLDKELCGMDLRDYFAAKAMQGFISSYVHGLAEVPLLDIAKDAYDVADAMLKARGQA